MADSSCSGSTPFKGLVDHGAQDRSLHRDRFSSTPSLQQGFRSTSQTVSAPAQAGFGEFLDSNGAGQVSINTPQTLNSPASSFPRGLQSFQSSAAPASRIIPPNLYQSTSQIPTASRQNVSMASPPRTSSWAQDFASFSRAPPGAGNYTTGFSSSQYPAPVAGFTQNMMGSHLRPWLFGPQGGSVTATNHGVTNTEADFDVEMNRWMAANGDGQMEDLDTVMEQLARELEQEQQPEAATQASRDTTGSSVDTFTTSLYVSVQDEAQGIQTFDATASTNQQIPGASSVLGIDAIGVSKRASFPDHMPDLERLGLDEAEQASAEHVQSTSDISEAARQILDSVQHEQGDKWKNSRFLSLMKDFRDGNKDIVNNEILETKVGSERIGRN
ncbi:uncharacterized protein CCOS01_09358 [Colletotrichum costaricense]|uniref:Peroxin 20 n=1 Tax=Colletotrichum costaricense TaxID=1209916 RepID=A0AAI9YUF5_9PEZI|nr:uncharacterized protein CCOS01_09358 [Colletotrichum costaricense]KAK1524271.1 hypothetical protein CCOS01_09358 [Colletotrichum costaricense]